MPRVKIDYIVSFSNEDPEHPASNLLSWEVGKRRWLCRAGESSCSVVLQLTHAVEISAIHIGSYHAAVIEVLVGRSETPNDPFEVVVPSSVFLSPAEARRAPQDRVRSFSGEQLARAPRGDRVRVVCRQPYNKQCKYGLSFIHIYEPESDASSAVAARVPSPAPLPAARAIAASTNFGYNSSDDDDYRPGQLFAAVRASAGASTSTETQIRQATSHILKNISDTSTKIVKSPIVKNNSSSKQNNSEQSSNRERNSLMYNDDDEQPHKKIDTVVQRHNDERAREKEARDAKEKLQKQKKERENTIQKESQTKRDENRGNKHDKTKDDHRASSHDLDTSEQNRAKNHKHNASRTDKDDKNDTPRRDDSNLGQRNRDDKAKRDDRRKDDRNRHNDSKEEVRPGRSNDDSRNTDKTTPNRNRDNSDQDRKTGVKRPRSSNDSEGVRAGPISQSPHTLLRGCGLVLSGYVHPRRGRVRAAAAALGGAVLPHWGPEATHLICAFPNTPKLRQALATDPSTPVATGEWVEKCCELRRLLPWQWFATEPKKRLPMPDLSTLPDSDNDNRPGDEECDTDEEIEKVLREQKKRRRSNTPATQAENTDRRDDSTDDVEFVRDERIKGRLTVHDSDSDDDKTVDGLLMDCDDDEGKVGVVSQTNNESDGEATDPEPSSSSPRRAHSPPRRTHSPLPNFFDGLTFYIAPDVSEAGFDSALLQRYVRAYGGVLVEECPADGSVDYVLCGARAAGGARGVRADWLWRCHARRRRCGTDAYLMSPADTQPMHEG